MSTPPKVNSVIRLKAGIGPRVLKTIEGSIARFWWKQATCIDLGQEFLFHVVEVQERNFIDSADHFHLYGLHFPTGKLVTIWHANSLFWETMSECST